MPGCYNGGQAQPHQESAAEGFCRVRRGTDQINFTLNFSKGASQIVAQYYQFLRLGRAGYTKIMQNCHAVAMYLQKAIEDSGYFTIISARDPVPMLPLATFSLKPEFRLNGCAHCPVLCLSPWSHSSTSWICSLIS